MSGEDDCKLPAHGAPAEDSLPAYYARRAAEYERIYERPERQGDLARMREVVPRLLAGRDLLEVACGTGYWTCVIAPLARSILATDVGEEVLEIARAKSYPPGRVRFASADAMALGQPRGPLDAAFIGFFWSHVEKSRLAGFLRGLHAVLKPGARVVAVDNRFVAGSSTPLSRTDSAGNTYQRRRLADGSDHEVLKNFPAAEDLRRTVAPIGEEVEVQELTYYWVLSYRAR